MVKFIQASKPSFPLLIFLVIAETVSILSTIWIHYQHIALGHVITEGLISLFLSGTVIYIIHVTQRYFHSGNVFNLSNIATLLFFTLLHIAIFHFSISVIYSNNVTLLSYHINTLLYRGIILLFLYSICLMSFWINQQKKREERIQHFAIEKEREAIRIELNSIQQQFKPHFLFNSLNSIGALCISNPKEARKMIQLLSDFMRKAVRENENDMIQLADEIEHMQRYTEIEKIRFGHRLSVIYKINEDCFEELLPSFILQPIIENAIKYGLYGSIDDIQIKVTINKTPDNLFIVISNPFDLDSSQESGGTGYGLQSIRKKLLLIYKQSNLLSTRQENNIFITELTIPKS